MRRLALLPRLDVAVGGARVDDVGVDGVVVGADVLKALEVSDAPDLERAVLGARVEQHGVVHRGSDGGQEMLSACSIQRRPWLCHAVVCT